MHRSDLHTIAQEKIDDAMLLLQHGKPSNAYYLAGYAIEIGLKACIAKQILSDTITDLAFVKSIYSHKIGDLIKIAGLAGELDNRQASDADFAINWAIVREWRPEERYKLTDTETAQQMVSAISDPKTGVLQWIKAYW